jgi:hypothetical protein
MPFCLFFSHLQIFMHNLVKISGFENQTNSIFEIGAKNYISSNNVQQKKFL